MPYAMTSTFQPYDVKITTSGMSVKVNDHYYNNTKFMSTEDSIYAIVCKTLFFGNGDGELQYRCMHSDLVSKCKI